jgi:hypothetical protein
MPLREAAIALRFSGGLESKMDAKAVPTTRLLRLENAVFTRGLSLAKRYGYTSLGLSVLGQVAGYEHPRGLGVRGDELVLFTDDSSYSYVEGAAAWNEIGGVTSVKQTDRALIKTVSAQVAGDYAAVASVGVAAWEDSRGGVYFAIIEDNEGRVTYAPTLASATGARPRCVRCGDKLALLWAEADGGQIKLIMIDPAQPHTYDTAQFPRVIVDDLIPAFPNYDAEHLGDQHAQARGAAVLCWNATGGVRVGVLDPSGVMGSPVTGWVSPSTTVPAAAVVCGPTLACAPWRHDQVAIAWATATNAYVATVLELAASTTPGAAVALGVSGADALAVAWRYQLGAADADAIEVWLEDRNATAGLSTVTHKRVDVGAGALMTDPTPTVIRGSCLASRAWTDCVEIDATDGTHTAAVDRAYVTLIHDVPLFGVCLTVRDDGLCVARTLPGNVGNAPATPHLPSILNDGARGYRWTAVYKTRLDSVNKDVFTEDGLRLISLDFGAGDSHQAVYAGRTLYLGGACPQMYDGAGWVEAGFHYAPDWADGEVIHVNSAAGLGGGG